MPTSSCLLRSCFGMVLLLVFDAVFSQAAHAAGAVNEIVLWTRKPGAFADDQNPYKKNIQLVPIEASALRVRKMHDVQYGSSAAYKGKSLSSLISSYKYRAGADLALLHFENGMVVPVSLDQSTLRRLDVFVAFQICEAGPKSCTSDFPEVARENAFGVTDDPRPIRFNWNKLVVQKAWHPDVQGDSSGFSPWLHTNSLVGIEFAERAAYYRQFEVGAPDGLAVFKARCQFCHGVRYVGAKMGWDFVTPLPIYEKRSPESLLNHVKYPKAMAMKMGLLMPNQGDITRSEVDALWLWLRAATRKPLPPYRP